PLDGLGLLRPLASVRPALAASPAPRGTARITGGGRRRTLRHEGGSLQRKRGHRRSNGRAPQVGDGAGLRVAAAQERLEHPRARGMAELAQRLRLDLADALASDGELLADLLERVLGTVADAEAHLQHLLLAGRERLEDARGLLATVEVDDGLERRHGRAILDEVAEV